MRRTFDAASSTRSQCRSGPVSSKEMESARWKQPEKFLVGKSTAKNKNKDLSGKNKNKKNKDEEDQHLRRHRHGFWKWRFFHSRSFLCVFSIHIHAVRNLPLYSTHASLLEIHCYRKSRSAKTLPSRALHGTVQFEETLRLHSKVTASKAAPHSIKHPVSKSFRLLVVSSLNQLVLGELTLDLGSILPDAIADTADFAASSAWTAAFRISASETIKGASVVASIGYEFVNFSNAGGGGAVSSNPSLRSESCRFAAEQDDQHRDRQRSTFWRRLRPLSGLVNASSSLFSRSESIKSMPDLDGLAQEACSSSCSDNDQSGELRHKQQDPDLSTAPDSRLDSMLCSLVQAQLQSTSKVENKPAAPAMEEPVEISKEDYSLEGSTGSEEEVDSIAETGKELAVANVASKPALKAEEGEDEEQHEGTNDSLVMSIYDEANSVARQFLKMLEAEDESEPPRELEPLGSPVYEGNWILAPIPEEEDEGDAATATRYIQIAAPVPKLQLPAASPEPAVNSAELQAFVPVPAWKREDDLDLACVMKSAELELHRATTNVMRTRAGLVEGVESEAFMRRWGLEEDRADRI